MRRRSANRYPLVVTYSVFLLGSLGSPREVPMKSGQKGQSQEQVTRTTVDNFNEIFNRHDADGLAPFLTEDTMPFINWLWTLRRKLCPGPDCHQR